jgi:hypothetical protein
MSIASARISGTLPSTDLGIARAYVVRKQASTDRPPSSFGVLAFSHRIHKPSADVIGAPDFSHRKAPQSIEPFLGGKCLVATRDQTEVPIPVTICELLYLRKSQEGCSSSHGMNLGLKWQRKSSRIILHVLQKWSGSSIFALEIRLLIQSLELYSHADQCAL